MSLYCAATKGRVEIVPRGTTVELWIARDPDQVGICALVLTAEQLKDLIVTLTAAGLALDRNLRVLEIAPGVYGASGGN